MTDVTSATDVSWAWRSDDSWVSFPKKVAVVLENAYSSAKKPSKVKVDKERFVDFSLTLPEIKKNFSSKLLDCDDSELVGVQRRYDDESKRRAVKRLVENHFFKPFTVFVAIDLNDNIIRVLKTYSATISSKLTTKTKLVITSKADEKIFSQELEAAKDNDIPVVTEDWILDSVVAGEAEDLKGYAFYPEQFKKKAVTAPPPKKAIAPPKSHGAMEIDSVTPPAPSKKTARPDDSDDDAPPVKKTKLQASSSKDLITIPSVSPDVSGLPEIDVPSTWVGVCSYQSADVADDFPFRVEISSYKAKKLLGTVSWPTLDGAKTKIRGTIEGDTVMFEEYEAISGADQVQIPSFYRGKITDFAKKIKGETIPNPNGSADDDFTKATFELDLIDKDESSADSPKKKKKTGVEYPFTFNVTKRTGNNIVGTIKWEKQKYEAKFKGTVTATGIEFEEFEVVSNEGNVKVDLPLTYNAKFKPSEASFVGKSSSGGAFKLEV